MKSIAIAARDQRGLTLSGQTISKGNRRPSKGSDPFDHGRLVTALLGAMICLCDSTFAAVTKPNILLILPDQMRASAMGCMGNTDVKTPHIDQMAASGILFRRTYANVPVCCPARAILLTGTYPHVNGMIANDLRLRESQVTLAEILHDAGYRTGFIGKWHLDGGPRDPGYVPPGPRRQGFDFWAAYECHHKHFEPTYFRDTPEIITVKKFEPEASCDFAVQFLQSQPKDQPFFLTVQMGPPHDPYGAPEEYMQRYIPERITPPANWQPGSETRPAPAGGKARVGSVLNRFVPLGGLEEIAAYYAAISAVDDQVGRLISTLKDSGLDDNTIILFTSDHGDMLGSHGLRRKRKPYDESARVPGIVRWPARIPSGQSVETLFSHVDMAPTLLALAGLQIPSTMQGTDLSRVALGETTDGPEAVLLQIFVPFNPDQVAQPWRGIVTAEQTYARYEDKPWVLFDHQHDPSQMHNLIGDASQAELQRKLDRMLTELMKKTGDAWSFNSSELVEEGGRLYRHAPFYTLEEYRAWVTAHPDLAK
ncbi:MAG: sulfatase [Planctomycetes bacterium]|nr:sulfatase [Planctomycetota bacterium]